MRDKTILKKKPLPILSVARVLRLSPHMIRVTLSGPEIARMAAGCEGANCKIFLPASGQTRDDFEQQLHEGPRPTVRTYTVRHMRPDQAEMDIDFVDHGSIGPASAWARTAEVGAFCGFGGPGPVKVTQFYADRYLVAADMSALPVAAATLEAMPRDATGDAYFEIMHSDDIQRIDAPEGVRLHWLVNPRPTEPDGALVRHVRGWDWPQGVVQPCIAGESSAIKDLRHYLLVERGMSREDAYISGYWKIGLIEDEHQKLKRAEAG